MGDAVKGGQMIAEAQGPVGVPVHARIAAQALSLPSSPAVSFVWQRGNGQAAQALDIADVVTFPTKYPSGGESEKQLIEILFDMQVPSAAFPQI